jgi:hypothetical protein
LRESTIIWKVEEIVRGCHFEEIDVIDFTLYSANVLKAVNKNLVCSDSVEIYGTVKGLYLTIEEKLIKILHL